MLLGRIWDVTQIVRVSPRSVGLPRTPSPSVPTPSSTRTASVGPNFLLGYTLPCCHGLDLHYSVHLILTRHNGQDETSLLLSRPQLHTPDRPRIESRLLLRPALYSARRKAPLLISDSLKKTSAFHTRVPRYIYLHSGP
jgi:hypothetical protein